MTMRAATARAHGRDRRLIYGAALLRGLAAGAISVLAAVYLAKRGFPADDIGIVLSAGMAGVLAGTFYGTFAADRVGRRRSLVLLALLAASGGAALAWFDSLWSVALAAFVGMLGTQGSDRGAAQALEVSMLPATTSDADRTRVYAWYNALADIGGAGGALLAALPAVLRTRLELTELRAYDTTILLYAALLVAAATLYARLSRATEPARADTTRAAPDLPASARRNVWRFAGLSAMDSLGGGFIGSALIAYYLYARFGIGEGALALLFAAARVMTVLSHFAAAWLAARIGLVNTMVFTHIPSSLLLMTLPVAPSFAVAALLFILREGLSEMDVPTRQSYLMAIVPPHERAWASGLTQLARAAGRMIAPAFAGAAMQAGALWLPLIAGASIKIAYDLLLWRAFRATKPPEER
ncbi:MAG TPA: MFS transporter [Burkholderiaceae bacterium]|nr:MFS transporter [Burkholderiaceae bacterium]